MTAAAITRVTLSVLALVLGSGVLVGLYRKLIKQTPENSSKPSKQPSTAQHGFPSANETKREAPSQTIPTPKPSPATSGREPLPKIRGKAQDSIPRSVEAPTTPENVDPTPLSPEELEKKVTAIKELGNDCIRNRDYLGSLKHYCDALALQPSAIVYSNRALANFCLRSYEDSLNDANRAIELDPSYTKGYGRKITALQKLGRLQEALEVCQDVLQIDPNYTQVKEYLVQIQKELEKSAPKPKPEPEPEPAPVVAEPPKSESAESAQEQPQDQEQQSVVESAPVQEESKPIEVISQDQEQAEVVAEPALVEPVVAESTPEPAKEPEPEPVREVVIESVPVESESVPAEPVAESTPEPAPEPAKEEVVVEPVPAEQSSEAKSETEELGEPIKDIEIDIVQPTEPVVESVPVSEPETPAPEEPEQAPVVESVEESQPAEPEPEPEAVREAVVEPVEVSVPEDIKSELYSYDQAEATPKSALYEYSDAASVITSTEELPQSKLYEFSESNPTPAEAPETPVATESEQPAPESSLYDFSHPAEPVQDIVIEVVKQPESEPETPAPESEPVAAEESAPVSEPESVPEPVVESEPEPETSAAEESEPETPAPEEPEQAPVVEAVEESQPAEAEPEAQAEEASEPEAQTESALVEPNES